jgi:hypothetical protein
MQDLPHGGGGDAMAEADQFALHTPVSQVGFSVAMRMMSCLIAAAVGGTSGSAARGVVPFARDEFAVPGQDRGGSDGENLGPAAARQQP